MTKKSKKTKKQRGAKVLNLAPVWRKLLKQFTRCPICDEECEVIQVVIVLEKTKPRTLPFFQMTVHHTTNKGGEDIAQCVGSGKVWSKRIRSFTILRTFPEVATDSEGLRKAQRWA